MGYAFQDLVDIKRIKALLTGFYDLTTIPSAISDSSGTILIGVGWRKICSDFHRKHPETALQCEKSDSILSRIAGQEGRVTSRQCLNGLVDVAVPIIIRGEHVANLFMGQFFSGPKDWDFFRSQAQRFGFDEQAYLAALEAVPVFNWEKTSKEIRFLAHLAELIGEMGLDQMRLREFNTVLEKKVEMRTLLLRKEIDTRRQAEEATRKTLTEFETIFNNSSVGIFYEKGDRSIHRANTRYAEMFGYTPEELTGKNTRFMYPDDDAYERAGSVYAAMDAKNAFVHGEYEFRRRNGELFWCALYGKAVNPAAVREGVIWIAIDITQRKDFERLREDVDAILRHDLKVPINGIIGLSNSLMGAPNLSEEQVEILELIVEAGYTVSNQINQSLEIYKLETGRYAFQPQCVDVGVLLQRVMRDLQAKAEEQGVAMRLAPEGVPSGPAESFLARADEMLSYTMFSNLVDNALEATPPGGEVTVRLRLDERHCIVSVHNPSEVFPEIRDNFFDKHITAGKTHGTGLGTYSAKIMAEAQHGDIRMTSSDKEGTAVRVRLPLSQSAG